VAELQGPLSNDIAALHAMVRELEGHALRLRQTNESLRRRLYGRKSEKTVQLVLPGMEAMAPPQIRRRRGKGGRHRLPSHLPKQRILIDLPEEEKAGLIKIREEVTEILEFLPGQYGRVHYIRPVYAHPDKAHPPKRAALPPLVIPQAAVGPALLARILIAKYADHAPFYRQAKIAARDRVILRRQKLWHWCRSCAELLRTIYIQLVARILADGYVQADETTVAVLDPARPGSARQGYFWAFLSPKGNAVVFEYHGSRGGECPESFFPIDWSGILQTDGYRVYASLVLERPGIIHVACLAHARRYVHEAYEAGDTSNEVLEMLRDYQLLYAVEKEAADRQLNHEQRGQLRGERCPSIFGRMHARYLHARATVLPESALGKAADYALNRWTELTRYAQAGFGHVEVDNNPIERSIRPIKLGLKNYLFIGHPDAGWCSAEIYSIVSTCELLDVNPEAYLTWVLPRLAAGTNQSTASGLLPHDYAKLTHGGPKADAPVRV
jgi:transposase